MKELETMVVQTADKMNRNGRLYPRAELEKLVGHPAVYGELSFFKETELILSKDTEVTRLTINLDNASHIASDFRMVGDDLVCSLRLVGPKGKIVKEIMEKLGEAPQLALRGFFPTPVDGVVRDYQMVTVDIVSERA